MHGDIRRCYHLVWCLSTIWQSLDLLLLAPQHSYSNVIKYLLLGLERVMLIGVLSDYCGWTSTTYCFVHRYTADGSRLYTILVGPHHSALTRAIRRCTESTYSYFNMWSILGYIAGVRQYLAVLYRALARASHRRTHDICGSLVLL